MHVLADDWNKIKLEINTKFILWKWKFTGTYLKRFFFLFVPIIPLIKHKSNASYNDIMNIMM